MRLHATKLGSIANSRGFGDQLFDLAGETPNLDLNFAGTKTLDPRITFTRASTGTYVGSDGLVKTATTNEARFDHNPTTGESLGLLVEEARTNLLLRSEEFGTWWTPIRATVTSNSTTAPNGTVTADTLIEDTTATNSHLIYAGAAAAAGTYTFSIYAKAAGRTVFEIQQESGGNSRFTLTGNGTALALGANTVSVTNVGNGWYRCTSSYTATALHFNYITLNNGSTTFYTGDGTSGIYFWGAQLEAGASPTSYIPTTTATATRAADVASITGTNFSSWYNQTEGTVFADANVGSGVFPYAYGISDGTGNNRILLYRVNNPATSSTPFDLRVDSGGSNSASFTINAATTRFGFAYKANDFAVSGNGGAAITDATGAVPSVNQMTIGGPTFFQCNGTIKRFTYWPVRLANPTLQAITAS
jgi:hypothetical protein